MPDATINLIHTLLGTTDYLRLIALLPDAYFTGFTLSHIFDEPDALPV